MKKLILAAAMVVSASSAFANRCEVHMVDNYTNRLLGRFAAYDLNDGCKEGMKECRKQIRLQNRLNTADCIRAEDRYPGPQNPGPTYPGPTNPGPTYPGQDIGRSLFTGEQVYYNNRIATVIGVGYDLRSYAIRTTDVWNNTISLTNIRRELLSVTTGCNYTLCANDVVISLNSSSLGKNARVVGLSTDNRFVIETTDVWNNRIIQSSVDRSYLAETKGCAFGRTQICVGDRVINNSNREGLVIGIQTNGFVVLRTTDVWNNSVVQTSVDPSTLYTTRR